MKPRRSSRLHDIKVNYTENRTYPKQRKRLQHLQNHLENIITIEEVATPERQENSPPQPAERDCNSMRIIEFCPVSPSTHGTDENNECYKSSEPNQEDGSERVCAVYMELYQEKLKLATRKKCSEILRSTTEERILQFQKIQTRIQAVVSELTSLGDLNRKQVEALCHDFQENLDKFNKDVVQHFQDWRSSLEKLEEKQQRDLNETIERQKVSLWELRLEVKETVKSQLDDAERRIDDAKKLEGERLLKLQNELDWISREI